MFKGLYQAMEVIQQRLDELQTAYEKAVKGSLRHMELEIQIEEVKLLRGRLYDETEKM